jgi:hypothetical protein
MDLAETTINAFLFVRYFSLALVVEPENSCGAESHANAATFTPVLIDLDTGLSLFPGHTFSFNKLIYIIIKIRYAI